jgi:uncharacterized protein (DUF1800 family)
MNKNLILIFKILIYQIPKKILPFFMITGILFFIACEDTTNINTDISKPKTKTIIGTAIDGYIKDASVCLDINLNNFCDDNEPFDTTNANGGFSFITTKNGDYPIIVSKGVDISTNEAFIGTLKNIVSLKDDKNSINITPLTTLSVNIFNIEKKINSNYTFNQAKQTLATRLGLDLSQINSNPLKNKKVFIKSQQIMQLTTLFLEEISNNITAIKKQEAFDYIIKQIAFSLKDDDGSKNLNVSAIINQLNTKKYENKSISISLNVKEFAIKYIKEIETKTNNIDLSWLSNLQKTFTNYTKKAQEKIQNKNTSTLNKIFDDSKDKPKIDIKKEVNSSTNTTTSTIHQDNITRADAIKFLKQASISIKEKDINFIKSYGYKAWINEQFSKSFEDKHKLVKNLYNTISPLDSDFNANMGNPTKNSCEKIATVKKYNLLSKSLWWQRAFDDDDQLRQKVAYALSQIIVVSAQSPAGNLLKWRGEALAYHYDILQKNAFGNYKDLLRDITFSPSMAYYMTYIGSAKYDTAKGTSPDENYARELMQLFSIGINELNDDGTIIQENGKDKPSYTQEDVVQNSKIMTGYDTINSPRFGRVAKKSGCYIMPIKFTLKYHDLSEKTILGTTVKANQSGVQDIESLLTILMDNKNMAPFISKRLIQKLVTSNPSKEYIKRVVAIFNNDGNGVKGNLKAVIQAILLDTEARENTNKNSGKVDELMTSLAHLLSTFNVRPTNSWKFYNKPLGTKTSLYWISSGYIFNQAVLSAPDVFNFYDVGYSPNDTSFSKSNLIAPELQIQTSINLIRYSNFLYFLFKNDKYYLTNIDKKKYKNMQDYMTKKLSKRSTSSKSLIYVDLTDIYETFNQALDGNKNGSFINLKDDDKLDKGLNKLINYLNHKMLGDTLPNDYKTKLIEELKTIKGFDNNLGNRARQIIVTSIIAIATSPYYMIIR